MKTASTVDDVVAELMPLARIATGLIDGDEAKRIILPRAYWYATDPHPEQPFLSGDYMDFDTARHDRMKKFLLRLERLGAVGCDAGLWMLIPGHEHLATVAVHNGDRHRWYRFGESSRALEPEMRACIERREAVAIRPADRRSLVTVLAPVLDSLGDAVGFVELNADDPSSDGPRAAWS